jgi:hypothetical protein
MAPSLVFAVALCFSLWHHFTAPELRTTFFGDSRHYLESCRQLVAVLAPKLPRGPGAPAPTDSGSLSGCLMLDGPILPLMPAVFFALTGKMPCQTDWRPFLILECLLHALSACLVYLLANRLFGDRKWAVGAGLLWGLYPSAVVACGRYLTETPAVLFLLALVGAGGGLVEAGTAGARATFAAGVVLGVWNGIILIFKPALVPVWSFTDILAAGLVTGKRQRALAAAAIVAGLCLVIAPWAGLSKALTGKVFLTPQRAPVYNVAKGCDTEADGWGALPTPPLTAELGRSKSGAQVLITAWSNRPGEMLNLTLRKIARLWGTPWNDFRVGIAGIPAETQALWHALILILAVPGALAVIAGVPLVLMPPGRRRLACFIGWGSILAFAAHIAYLPFEAISRYGFTAMPFAAILAAYAVFVVVRLRRAMWPALLVIGATACLAVTLRCGPVADLVSITGDFRSALLAKLGCEVMLILIGAIGSRAFLVRVAADRRLASLSAAVVTLAAGFAVAIAAAFCLDGRQAREWACVLRPGQSACRSVVLPAAALKGDDPSAQAFLLIDGDSSCRASEVTINGHRVPEPPELLLRLKPSNYSMFETLRTFAARLGKPIEDMRQWRAVWFPRSWLRSGGPNIIRLTAGGPSPVTIYGDYRDRSSSRDYLPSLTYFSAGMLCNSVHGTEGRLMSESLARKESSPCWFERKGRQVAGDLSAIRGTQTGRYRLFLMIPDRETRAPRSNLLASEQGTSGKPARAGPWSGGGDVPGIRSARSSLVGAYGNAPAATEPAGGTGIPAPSARTGARVVGQGGVFCRQLSPADFDPVFASAIAGSQLHVSRAVYKAAASVTCSVPVPGKVLQAPFVRIKVSGSMRAAGGECMASVVPVLQGGGNAPSFTVLPATPPCLTAGTDWTFFQISDIVPPAEVVGGMKSLTIGIYPGPWEEVCEYRLSRRTGDALFRDLTVEVGPVPLPPIGCKGLSVY